MHWMPKFGHFQIAHKIWGRLNAWKGRYVDLAAKTGLFALLDRSRYEGELDSVLVEVELRGSRQHVRVCAYRAERTSISFLAQGGGCIVDSETTIE